MTKLKAILIDDEVNCTEILKYDISMVADDVEIVRECHSAKDGLLAIKDLNPDIVFLDIEMPWMNGFELLDALPSIDFAVIFVTAFDQFAIKAFRYYALDYIMKPVDQDLLRVALDRARRSRRSLSKQEINDLHNFIRNDNNQLTKLVLPNQDGYEFVQITDIVRCQASANYAIVHFKDTGSMVISKPLKYLNGLLEGQGFFRPHQSHLINLSYVVRYTRADGGGIVMNDGTTIPIARNRKEEFQRLIFGQ